MEYFHSFLIKLVMYSFVVTTTTTTSSSFNSNQIRNFITFTFKVITTRTQNWDYFIAFTTTVKNCSIKKITAVNFIT